jgi:hypothetical protein
MKYVIIFCFSFFASSKSKAQTSLPDTSIAATADSSALYGFSPQRPIKVGGTYINGVANQKKYLEALRDAQGKAVSYERNGSCCAYPSANGFEGHALLDWYEVKYRDTDNKKKKAILYISFYDYEEPKAVKGFTLVQ